MNVATFRVVVDAAGDVSGPGIICFVFMLLMLLEMFLARGLFVLFLCWCCCCCVLISSSFSQYTIVIIICY